MEKEKFLPSWNYGVEIAFSDQLDGCSFNSDAFESALSSMASSPTGSEFFSFPPVMPLRADPGFAERAARFSCFRNMNEFRHGLFPEILPGNEEKLDSLERVTSSSSCKKPASENAEFLESREASSISEHVNLRKVLKKRKTKKMNDSCTNAEKAEKNESNSKRRKSYQESESYAGGMEKRNADPRVSEPEKDYIHVRARRGQATDSHSLAERVRREKISERMKLLQDLVPGCNKVTGKAVMLDEIINYVQSLQGQVEFLSMKLASINPLLDTNEHSIGSGWRSREVCFHPDPYPLHSGGLNGSGFGFPYGLQLPHDPSVRFQTSSILSHPSDRFGVGTCQASTFWQDDLSSI